MRDKSKNDKIKIKGKIDKIDKNTENKKEKVDIKENWKKYKSDLKESFKKYMWDIKLGYKPLKPPKPEDLKTSVQKLIRTRKNRSIEAEIENIMFECGLYNNSGDYAYHIKTIRYEDNDNHYTTLWKLPFSMTFKMYIDKTLNFANSLVAQVIIEEDNGLLKIEVFKGVIPRKVNYKFITMEYLDKCILPIPLGKNPMGLIVWDLIDVFNVLIAGSVGGGKSILATGWADALLQNPDVLLFVIDLAMTDFIHLQEYTIFAGDIEKARIVLDMLWDEVKRRLDILVQYKKRKLRDYNKSYPDAKLPYLVLFIDEFAFTAPGKFHTKQEKILLNYLQKKTYDLAQLGRKAGVRLVICMQRPDRDLISPIIKNNLCGRISFKCNDKGHSLTVLGNTDANYLPDVQGRFISLCNNKQIEAQALYLDPDIAIDRCKLFNNLYDRKKTVAKYFYNKGDEFNVDPFIQFQINDNETKRLLPR